MTQMIRPKPDARRVHPPLRAWLCIIAMALALVPQHSIADEGGVSFWLPGQFGSFAAVPQAPGWSLPLAYFHASSSASGSKNFPIGGKTTAGVDGRVDALFAFPTYVFSQPLLGGQASVGVGWGYGTTEVSADATLTGPRGNVVTLNPSDSTPGGSDLYPQAALRWNDGNNNFVAYTMAGVPVGTYQLGRLANLGTNHWAIDAGGGYT